MIGNCVAQTSKERRVCKLWSRLVKYKMWSWVKWKEHCPTSEREERSSAKAWSMCATSGVLASGSCHIVYSFFFPVRNLGCFQVKQRQIMELSKYSNGESLICVLHFVAMFQHRNISAWFVVPYCVTIVTCYVLYCYWLFLPCDEGYLFSYLFP